MSLMHKRNLTLGLTIGALGLIGFLTAAPAYAYSCAAPGPVPAAVAPASLTSTATQAAPASFFAATNTVTPAGIVSPQMIQWAVFQTNMQSEATCESLMYKMKKTWPASYHWLCEPYYTNSCPSVQKWTLFFGENGV
jgi:hypothetical protein